MKAFGCGCMLEEKWMETAVNTSTLILSTIITTRKELQLIFNTKNTNDCCLVI